MKRRPRLTRECVHPADLAIYLEALKGVNLCRSAGEHAGHMAARLVRFELTEYERAEFAKRIEEATNV